MLKTEPDAVQSQPGFELHVQLFAMDGAREAFPARIRRVNNGFFQLRTTIALDAGRKLVMGCETCRVELEVVYCQRPELGPCYVGARVVSTDTSSVRKEIRLPVEIAARVSVPGLLDRESALVVDVSSGGMGLELPVSVAPGSMIAVDIGKGIVFGEVRHSSEKSPRVFRTGITIEEFIARDHPLALQKKGRELHNVLAFLRKLKNSVTAHN